MFSGRVLVVAVHAELRRVRIGAGGELSAVHLLRDECRRVDDRCHDADVAVEPARLDEHRADARLRAGGQPVARGVVRPILRVF